MRSGRLGVTLAVLVLLSGCATVPLNPSDYRLPATVYPADEVWCQRAEFLLYQRFYLDRRRLEEEAERRRRVWMAREIVAAVTNPYLTRMRQVIAGDSYGPGVSPDLRAAHEWLRKEAKAIEADLIFYGCREPERQLRRE